MFRIELHRMNTNTSHYKRWYLQVFLLSLSCPHSLFVLFCLSKEKLQSSQARSGTGVVWYGVKIHYDWSCFLNRRLKSRSAVKIIIIALESSHRNYIIMTLWWAPPMSSFHLLRCSLMVILLVCGCSIACLHIASHASLKLRHIMCIWNKWILLCTMFRICASPFMPVEKYKKHNNLVLFSGCIHLFFLRICYVHILRWQLQCKTKTYLQWTLTLKIR